MNVILLEKIRNLGALGEQVSVKPGFARNYLYPRSKAIPATQANLDQFEAQRAELERQAIENHQQAQATAQAIAALTLTIKAKSGEEGKLFGSIGTRDIAHALTEAGVAVEKSAVQLPLGAIRQLGDFEVAIILHSDVSAVVKVSIIAE